MSKPITRTPVGHLRNGTALFYCLRCDDIHPAAEFYRHTQTGRPLSWCKAAMLDAAVDRRAARRRCGIPDRRTIHRRNLHPTQGARP